MELNHNFHGRILPEEELEELKEKFPLTDAAGFRLEEGNGVIYSIGNGLAYGEIIKIKKFRWNQPRGSWHVYLDAEIYIELFNDTGEKKAGHVSKVRNPNFIWIDVLQVKR